MGFPSTASAKRGLDYITGDFVGGLEGVIATNG